jgi:hypothetical protein
MITLDVRAMAYMVSGEPFTKEAWVQRQNISSGICYGYCSTGIALPQAILYYAVRIIPKMLNTDSFMHIFI